MTAGKYAAAADLPPKAAGPKQFGTEMWLKLTNLPDAWTGKLLQANVYAWDATAGAWEAEPVATSDRLVGGKGGVWQHTLTLLAEPGSDRAGAWGRNKPSLPPGKYLVKVYVDSEGRAEKDWKAPLGPNEYAGQAEFSARWVPGYGAMTAVDARTIRR